MTKTYELGGPAGSELIEHDEGQARVIAVIPRGCVINEGAFTDMLARASREDNVVDVDRIYALENALRDARDAMRKMRGAINKAYSCCDDAETQASDAKDELSECDEATETQIGVIGTVLAEEE